MALSEDQKKDIREFIEKLTNIKNDVEDYFAFPHIEVYRTKPLSEFIEYLKAMEKNLK